VTLGQINFGPTAEASFLRGQVAMQAMEIADLKAEVAELLAQRNQLRAVLQKCAALTPQISDAKHEALLATDPKNLHAPAKKLLL
jgi:hypothetical protein